MAEHIGGATRQERHQKAMIKHFSFAELGRSYSDCADQLTMSNSHYRTAAAYVSDRIPLAPGNRLLEAGCGNGWLMHALHDVISSCGLETFAIDISSTVLHNSRSLNHSTRHTLAALPHIPFGDKLFHAVVCSEVLEHCAAPKASLYELRRVMKDDGTLIVTVPNADVLGFDRYLADRRIFQPADDFMYTFAEAQNLFRQAGLRIHHYAGLGSCIAVRTPTSVLSKIRNRLILRWLNMVVSHIHPDAARIRKRIMFTLRKDDYLLNHDF